MKLLLKIFLSLLVIVVLLLLAGLFLPDKMELRRSVTINTSPSAVFQQVNSLRHFNNWSPWAKMDTTAQYTYTGDEGVGASLAWTSTHKQVGTGTMTITESIPCEKVVTAMTFEGHEEPAYASFLLSEEETGTQLTWTFESALGNNPVNRYVGWFISRAMGDMYEQGLASLQALMVARATEVTIPIAEVELSALRAIGVHSAAPTYYEMEAPMEAAFTQLGAYLEANRLTPSASFISAYLSGPETGSVRFFCGIASSHEVDATGAVQAYTLPAGRYVRATHMGSYEGMEATHAQIGAYLEANNLRVAGPVWDEYVVAEHVEPDPTKWVTHIHYPVTEACVQ